MVADVARYPDFIPLISATRIQNLKEVTPAHRQFEADAVVRYKLLSETFRSIVNVQTDISRIEVKKPNRAGAVKSLSNSWEFHALGDGSTLVEFKVTVSLQNFVLNRLVREKFDKASGYIMGLFEARADTLFEGVKLETLDMQAEYARLGLSQHVA